MKALPRFSLFLFLLLQLSAFSATDTAPAAAPAAPPLPAFIPIWPNGAPGSEGRTSPEVITMRTDPATPFSPQRTVPIITNINNPSITPFLPPPDQATGAALVIAPGGGHSHLSVEHEGYDVARYLSARGVTCFVVKYRLSHEPNSPYQLEVHSLMDVQRAVRYVRAHAADWKVDPHRVGLMGFSAGGQLSLLTYTSYATPVPSTTDAIAQVDCRPDFVALMYPGGLTNPSALPVSKDMPPAFLADAYDDPVSLNLAKFYVMLKTAGVRAELHIYDGGNEGFGMRPSTLPVSTWPDRFVAWLGAEGFLKKP